MRNFFSVIPAFAGMTESWEKLHTALLMFLYIQTGKKSIIFSIRFEPPAFLYVSGILFAV
jgi:hypothetical protein